MFRRSRSPDLSQSSQEESVLTNLESLARRLVNSAAIILVLLAAILTACEDGPIIGDPKAELVHFRNASDSPLHVYRVGRLNPGSSPSRVSGRRLGSGETWTA